MKVGIYIHDYEPVSGGGYTFQREILEAVFKSAHQTKHHFSILTYAQDKSLAKEQHPSAVNIIPIIQQPRKLSDYFFALLRKLKIAENKFHNRRALSPLDFTVQENNIDFVWFLTPAYELTNAPYLATVWDLQHRLQPWFPEVGNHDEWNGREAYISTLLRRAAFIITPNEAGRKEITLFYQVPETRIICLPHPTPVLTTVSHGEEQEILARYGLQSGYLFYPAQFWAHKNHANFLFALKTLKDSHGIMPVTVFVGSDKGNLAYIQRLADELGIKQQIHFLGFVSDSELTALYKNALALVYLSFFGPENLPPLEAFSIGCPVVASSVNGASEQLGDAVLFVDPSQPIEIATAIRSVMDDPQLRESLIARGFEQAKKMTSQHYIIHVFKLLDEFDPVRRNWEG